jgi:TatD DNase family protein
VAFIDAHAHLRFDEQADVRPVLERAFAAGVTAIINVCTELEDLQRGHALSKTATCPKVYTVAALTPHDAAKDDTLFFKEIQRLAHEKQLAAIGETGLDYYYNHAPKDVQIAALRRYLLLAQSANLPVVIHCRDAFDDLCLVIDETAPNTKVMLHCFTGSLEEAKRAVDRGWYVSMSGIVTFPKSTSLQEVAKYVPDELLLIETDSPYLAPQGFRGQKNEPALLVQTATMVATLRNTTADVLGLVTSNNVKRLFYGIS